MPVDQFGYFQRSEMDVKKKIAAFIGEFDLQIDQVENIYTLLEKRLVVLEKGGIGPEIVESTGYWLHNLYCAFEDLFKLVTGFWENNVPTDGEFHIHLLKRMLIQIQGIRPALLSDESYICLNEMRGFRHAFRHAYSYGLDEERVAFLLRRILGKRNVVMTDLKRFRKVISVIE